MESIAEARQRRLIAINDKATARGLDVWRRMDFANLDVSWAAIAPALTQQVNAAQLAAARSSDSFVSALAASQDFETDSSRIIPEALVGVDGSGRATDSLLHGSVTTTKESIRAGLGVQRSMESGAAYLVAMIKTALADNARSADLVSAAGKGYTRYARVVNPGACSRCVVLAGATQFRPFKRHPACRCTVEPIPEKEWESNPKYSPDGVFDAMSKVEQDKAFGKAGAQAIRDGADIGQVVSARRGASGIGYSHRMPTPDEWRRMRKTTIGVRPNGDPVQVYSTTEGTTVRGRFGKAQRGIATQKTGRYTSTKRVRLMPEAILEIAGDDTSLRQAFLRDAGYIEYLPPHGYDSGNKWIAEIAEMRRQDRFLVNDATRKFGNFYLGG